MTPATDPWVLAIVDLVAERFTVSREDILGPCREREYAWPRQVAMYLCRELTGMGWHKLGLCFDKDYTSVVYGHKKAGARAAADSRFSAVLAALAREAADLPERGLSDARRIMAAAEKAVSA